MIRKQCYSNLLSEELKLVIALNKVQNEKNEMIKAYNNCLTEEEKFLFILKYITPATNQDILENLVFLDTALNISEAKTLIKVSSQKLLNAMQIGSIRTNNQYGYYILIE